MQITSEGFQVDKQLQYIEEFAVNCTRPGYICDGCEASYICVDIGGGNFVSDLVKDCVGEGTTCLETTGECTADENLNCNQGARDYKFRCHQKGMFPHPFFCNQYFICCDESIASPPQIEPITCKGDGLKYDPLSTLCNKKGDCTTPPVNSCKVAGEIGGVQGHPSMYYVCLNREISGSKATSLLPDLYLCPDDQVFANGACA